MSPIASSSPELTGVGLGLAVPVEPEQSAVHPPASEEIDRLLARGWWHLQFPAHLEARFQSDCAAQRLRSLLINGALVSIIFNWMLWSDWLLVPDVFDMALKLRLFVFTPWTIACLFIAVLLPSPALREWAAFVWGLAATGITWFVCVSSTDPMAGPYLVSFVPVIMFANSVARLRFRQAMLLDGAVLLAFLIGWYATPPASLIVMVPATLVILSTIVFSLYSCYKHELDERQNWLWLLRETMLMHELEKAHERLDAISRIDMLTEVSNRRHFDEFLQQVWDRAKDDGAEISLMLIDIDHFRAYNDRYGQPEGDACLKDVAATLKRRLRRPGDLIARFGGEEFIAVLVGTPLATAVSAAERVRKGVENMNRLHATSTTHAVITVSIGVASLRPNAPHASPAQLMSAADEALHQAKSRGRNRVFAFGTDE
ncbi:MAG: GGDEF domain-containing protein [Aquabacterium sp.]